MNFSLKFDSIILWEYLGVILFKCLLIYSYISFVSPYYGYDGFYLNFDLNKFVQGWLVYLLLFFLLIRNKKHVVYMTLVFVFLILITPLIILYSLKGESAFSFYTMTSAFTLLLLFLSTRKIRLPTIKDGDNIAVALSICLVTVVLLHYLSTVGLHGINFDLSKVYDLRRSDESIASNSGIFGYLNPWVTKVFNVLLISVFLWRKKYFMLAVFVSIQFLLFGFSGHKAILFSLLLVFGLFFFDKKRKPTLIIIFSMSAFIALLLVFFVFTQEPLLPSILIRRAFFVPANLNYIYFEFFSINDYIYWSNGVLTGVLSYDYHASPPLLIGEYLGRPEMAANTGVLGSGFMQLGSLGIYIYILLLAIIINLIQQFIRLPIWLINSVVLMPLLSAFISSDLFTTLLTHGLLISVFVLFLYNAAEIKKQNGIAHKWRNKNV